MDTIYRIRCQDVDGIKKAMEKLKQAGDLNDEETEKILGAMTALTQNVKENAKKSLGDGVAKGGSGGYIVHSSFP